MNMAEIETAAAALFDGGWRAKDKEELITEYNLTADRAQAICEQLDKWEGE